MLRRTSVVGICLLAAWLLTAGASFAFPPFKEAFQKKYVDGSNSEAFKAAFKAEGCNVCHVKGEKDKKKRNAYGHEIHEALEEDGAKPKQLLKEDKEKLLKLLDEAFDAVGKKKSKSGKTFGELISEGILPAAG